MWKPALGVFAATVIGLPAAHSSVERENATTPTLCAADSVHDRQFMVNRYRWMMRGDDSLRVGVRAHAALDKADPTSIAAVTDTAVCRKAGIAYGASLHDTTPSRSVNVVKIGRRYVVHDPARRNGSGAYLTFDSTFTTTLAQTR